MTLTNSTSLTARAQHGDVTDETDPAAAPTRRTFTPEQKLTILAAHEDATGSRAKGALLRREGIYSSQITEWRKAPRRRNPWAHHLTHRTQCRSQRGRSTAQEERAPGGRTGQDPDGARHRGKSTRTEEK